MPLFDIATSQPSFRSHICKSTDHLINHYSVLGKYSLRKGRHYFSAWKVSMPSKVDFGRGHLVMEDMILRRAVSTFETKPIFQVEDKQDNVNSFQSENDPNSETYEYSIQTPEELAESEKLRRIRISKANKGNVPWNKGRKHSAETLQLIKEKTRLAMQNPKVKMKLMNLGHSQSMETRKKIGVGVRIGWQRRREKMMVQETCCFEWHNLIAEASRKGYGGQEELQWDSYKILDKQLEKEWLISIEQRKLDPKPKGNKRAPKSPEQRKKISEAISAKWADPEYRGRVCSALSKYHGTTVGVKRTPQKRRETEDGQPVKTHVKRKVSNEIAFEKKSQLQSRPKRRTAPLYKDPLADAKLEMIKNIRAQRMAMETKKIEAMERAKLLISEAEKAAKALEAAATTSPLAKASLLETRKLIAEATRSLEAVETGQIISYRNDNNSSLELNGLAHSNDRGNKRHEEPTLHTKEVNGTSVPLPSNEGNADIDFGNFAVQNLFSDGQHLETRSDGPASRPFQVNTTINGVVKKVQQVSPVEVNDAIGNESTLLPRNEETGLPRPTSSRTKSTKKWVCGRLVEVTEND